MLIAQFSDMHVKARGDLAFGKIDTAAMLDRCIEHVNALSPRPDVVLMTGDLTYDGLPEEYVALKQALARLQRPFLLIPGNHDMREHMRTAFGPTAPWASSDVFLHYAVEDYPLRLIGLDTVVPGDHAGCLCAKRLDWLAETLAAAPDQPTLLFMHHPPFTTGLDSMDRIGLDGAVELAAIVRCNPQIRSIVCGHIHRLVTVSWAGTIAMTAPSTAHQLSLNLHPAAAGTWRREPPALLLHLWQPGADLISHVSYIGDYGARETFAATDGTAY